MLAEQNNFAYMFSWAWFSITLSQYYTTHQRFRLIYFPEHLVSFFNAFNITLTKEGIPMAICHEMKKGDVYYCESCGLELQVLSTCSCGAGESDACSVPLQCCGKDMVKKAS